MDEQLKVAHQVVFVVDRANRKICVTLLRYLVDKTEGCCSQFRTILGKKEDEEFQHTVYANYKLEEVFYILDELNYLYDKDNTYQPLL